MTSITRWMQWLTQSRLLTLLAILAVVVMAARTPLDSDTYWHLRAGEWQVENRAILQEDLFSHSRAGDDWVNHSWLSQIALYGAFAVGDDAGLMIFTVVLALAGMLFILPTLSGNALMRAAVVILAAATASVFWSARPQMVSFALTGLVYWLLWRFVEDGEDYLWWLPPIMLLWVNSHGGFALGFILMVLILAGQVIEWLIALTRGDEATPQAAFGRGRRLVIIGLICAAVVSLNPNGPRMLLYPFDTVGVGILQNFIAEWASPDFHVRGAIPFMVMLLGTFAITGLSLQRIAWRHVLLLAVTGVMGLLAWRNVATFALVAAPILSLHLTDALDQTGVQLNFDRRPREVTLWLNLVLAILLILAVTVQATSVIAPATLEDERAALYPVAAVDWLRDNPQEGNLFNSYNWGGYVIWHLRDVPVAVDGRTDLYGDDLLVPYATAALGLPGWEDALTRFDAGFVLIESGSPLASLLSLHPDWERVYVDDLAAVYARGE